MKFAILAAGEGSRLAQEGVELPKPLVRVNGEAMIDRLVRIFCDCEAESIHIVSNNLSSLTREHINGLCARDARIHLTVRTTPSSMHSFHELRKVLGEGKFCLTTVDTIFREDEFRRYVQAWENSNEDGLMGVTDYVDDERPLYVATDEHLSITGFWDDTLQRYISGGIYGLSDACFPVLDRCIAEGQSRMRNFQRRLVDEGFRLRAYPFGKILDVDHADDIAKAEAFLARQGD